MATATNKHVRVGVGVLVKDPIKPTHIFAGIRRGSHGEGQLALPGGHLEMYESWEKCAEREVEEETGLILKRESLVFGHVTNDIMRSENKHYVTVFMMGECVSSSLRPMNLEPHKCEGWDSYSWNTLKNIASGDDDSGLKLFGPLQLLVEESPERVLTFLS